MLVHIDICRDIDKILAAVTALASRMTFLNFGLHFSDGSSAYIGAYLDKTLPCHLCVKNKFCRSEKAIEKRVPWSPF